MPKNPQDKGIRWLESDKPDRIVAFLLKSLHHSLRQALEEALRAQAVDLSFAHCAALFTLHYEPGITGAQVARRALVSAQTMNAVLRRLETDGLIERRPHPESRCADSWHLTEQGLEQLARARIIGDSVFSRMLGALSAAEVERLETYLRRCIAALGTAEVFAEASAPGTRGGPESNRLRA
jgi:DNA-binding MarR family transcriptional regulator